MQIRNTVRKSKRKEMPRLEYTRKEMTSMVRNNNSKTNCNVDKEQPMNFNGQSVIERIIKNLGAHIDNANILVIITPTKNHINRYKLHIIDRITLTYLSGINISRDQLRDIQKSNVLLKYCIAMSPTPIDSTNRSKIIRDIVNTLEGGCNCKRTQKNAEKNSTLIHANSANLITNNAKNITTHNNVNSKTNSKNNILWKSVEEKTVIGDDEDDVIKINPPTLKNLIPHLNCSKPISGYSFKDFFSRAEKENIKILIFPDLRSKYVAVKDTDKNSHHTYKLECYQNTYIGTFTLESKKLLAYLHLYPKLLRRVKVINEVMDIIPRTARFTHFCHTLCSWLGLEIFFDMYADWVFNKYKKKIQL